MRRLRSIVITFVIVVVGYFLLKKLHILPSLKNVFASKPVVADETPIVIKEIRSIGQLITYSASDEVVADSVIVTKGAALVNSFNQFSPLPLLPPAEKQLVIIGRGKVLAGVDLSLLTDTSVNVKNDTLRIFLPQTKILDAIINPSDFEVFVEKGDWTEAEATLVKTQARRKMIEHAIGQNIVPKAENKAKAIIENFLTSLGYRHIVIL